MKTKCPLGDPKNCDAIQQMHYAINRTMIEYAIATEKVTKLTNHLNTILSSMSEITTKLEQIEE